MMRSMTGGRILLVLVVLYAVYIVIFGWVFHPVEEADTAERDGYVRITEQISQGMIPKDRFRPLFYPMVSAGLRTLTGDAFTAARLTSSLAAIAFLAFTALLASRLVSCPAAITAVLLTAFNFHVMHYGVLATTDMLFSAFMVGCVLMVCSYVEKPTLKSVALMALAFALGFFTRYTAVAALLPIMAALIAVNFRSIKKVMVHTTLFAGLCVVFLVPHFIITHLQFGSPVYTENWKNIAFKLYGNDDWSYFTRIPYESAWDFLSSSYKAVLLEGTSTLANFVTTMFPNMISSISFTSTWIYEILFIAGITATLVLKKRGFPYIYLFMLSYTLLVCFTFTPMKRMMIVLLPFLYITSSYVALDLVRGWLPESIRARYRIVVMAALVAPCLIPLPGNIAEFRQNHPVAEVQKVRELAQEDARILGTLHHGWRHGGEQFRYLPNAFGEEKKRIDQYLEKVKAICRLDHTDYIVCGSLTIRERPGALLEDLDLPPWLVCVEKTPEFVVYKIDKAELMK